MNSSSYWKTRYNKGGNSGPGSYSNLANFKIDILIDFVISNNIKSVRELGCGDGNNLIGTNYKKYYGYDISEQAINMCKTKIVNENYNFILLKDDTKFEKCDLSLSLDVIFHLLEDTVYDTYMKQLFQSKYVIIYSSDIHNIDFEKKYNIKMAEHVKHRKFTEYIEKNYPQYDLISKIANKFPFNINNQNHTSFSDFYIYKRKDIIFSLTSYDKRINITHHTINTLLNQTLEADKIILWLPHKCVITKELSSQISQGLIIEYCDDICSYKKLIYTLQKYPNDIIITFDDDSYYDLNLVKNLYNSYLKDKNSIHASRCHIPNNNNFFNYMKWSFCSKHQTNNLFFTSGGGVLYPPNCFHDDVLKEDIFMTLCPTTDDIWFNYMARLKGTNIILVNCENIVGTVKNSQEHALFNHNSKNGNNEALTKLYKYFKDMYNFDIIHLNKFL